MAEEKKLSPSELFNNWSRILKNFSEKKGKEPSKKEVLSQLGLANKDLQNLLDFLKTNYQIEKDDQQTWADFFHQLSSFFSKSRPTEDEKITFPSTQPSKDQLQSLIAEKEAIDQQLIDSKKEIANQLEERFNLGQTEAERFVERLFVLQKQDQPLQEVVSEIKQIEEITAELPENYRAIPISTEIGAEILSRIQEVEPAQQAREKSILIHQIPAELNIKRRLINNHVPPKKAKEIARQAVEKKRNRISEKINDYIQVNQEIKTLITTAALADNYNQVEKILIEIKDLPKSDQKNLKEDLIETSQFIGSRETVAYQIRNPSEKAAAVIPENFQKKLSDHPQVVDTIASLVVVRASQNVPKENISFTITPPIALAITNSGMKIDKGEEEAISNTLSGISRTTLKNVSLKKGHQLDYQNLSALNLLQAQTEKYLGSIHVSQPASRPAARTISSFWVQEPATASQDFFKLQIKGKVSPSHSLKKLPSEDPVEIFAQLNADRDPLIAAGLGAQLAGSPPDILEEQISAWNDFIAHLEKEGQLEKIHQNKLLATFQTWYGDNGVAETVYANQLYQSYHGVRQTLSPITGFFKNQVFDKLSQTAAGKGINQLLSKGRGFVQEKIFQPVKKWAIGIIGKKAAAAGVKVAAGKGVTAAIAAALGVSTGGVALAAIAAWEGLKAGVGFIKKGLEKLGVNVDKIKDRLHDLLTLGLGTKISRKLKELDPTGIISTPLSWISSGILLITTVGIGATLMKLVTISIIGVFISLFFFQIFPEGQRRKVFVPPVAEMGDMEMEMIDIDIDPGSLDLLHVDVDLEQCEQYSGKSKSGCIATAVLKECFPRGINTNNTHLVRNCLTINSDLDPSTITHLTNQISWSANRYHYLQCVGYKRAVEPSLPYGVGNAKNYVSACTPVSKDNIQPGDNAVWTTGTYGHIALIIDLLPENDNSVLIVEAWGTNGRIHFSEAIIASISRVIRCP